MKDLTPCLAAFMLKTFQQHSPSGCGGLSALLRIIVILTLAPAPMLALGAGLALDEASTKPVDIRKKVELRAVPRPATSSTEQCSQIMQGLTAQSDQVIRVRKVLKDNLHWRGDRHTFIPRKTADWSDIIAAYSSLSEDDIPVLVRLIGRSEVKDGMLGIASGTLGRFGARALPCIEAGLAEGRTKGASDLSAVKINIEVELRNPPPGSP